VLWLVKSLKILYGVEYAPTIKLWFLELVIVVDSLCQKQEYLCLAVAVYHIQLVLVYQLSHYEQWARLNAPFLRMGMCRW
jgi:hypothetical protein